MPLDHYEDDDDARDTAQLGPNRKFKEFDCPDCNANNPSDPPFGNGDELLCNYCGSAWEVRVSDEGRLKLKEA